MPIDHQRIQRIAGSLLLLCLAPSVTAQKVDVVEFYNPGFDHYFISANAQEISDLDTGMHKGWARTGLTFKAFATAVAGTSPVCRIYIPPAQGDSHFFSASPAECAQTLQKFPGFVPESPNVFYIDLPDAATGACPSGDVAVYRVWDARADTNHRYATDPAVRTQMVAKGWVAEGYGPDQVIMCAPPATSRYFAKDAEADTVRRGLRTVRMPVGLFVDNFGLQWRIVNALRMLGLEVASVGQGQLIDAAAFNDIDRRLAARETLFDADAARLSNYAANWAPNFRDNIPRTFGVHMMARVLEAFNAGPVQYQRTTNTCLLANLVPQMCGALANFGTVNGASCSANPFGLREPQVIQMPELYGFNNVRRAIGADELPVDPSIPSSCVYATTLVHEFTHDLDRALYVDGVTGAMNLQFDRLAACSANLFDFAKSGHPFTFDGANGKQDPAEYVSGYASGLANAGSQDYRSFEDAAETVTAYILFPEYFRRIAGANAKLQARYDYVKTQLFGGVEFENRAIAPEANNLTRPAYAMNSLCADVHEFRMDDIVVRP